MVRSWWFVCVVAVGTLLVGCPFSKSVPVPPFASVHAGGGFSLALDEAGNAWAWGHDREGQLGVGGTVFPTFRTKPMPVRMPRGVRFTSVAPGSSHSLALDADGNAWAWGSNVLGQLGDGRGRPDVDAPVRVSMPGGVRFTSVAADSQFSLALDQHGNAWAWGANWRGELGDGSDVFFRYTPVPVRMPADVAFTGISAGSGHVLALDHDGNAWAWGWNAYGQLGDGSTDSRSTPVPVRMPERVTFASVVAGLSTSLALDRDGSVWAWGYDRGALGADDSPVRDTPVPVRMPEGVSFTRVSGDEGYVLALDQYSNVWESSTGGEGGAASSSALMPVSFPEGVTITSISGRDHSLALDEDGNVWAWRNNFFGQLGDGSRVSRDAPGRVAAP